MSEHLDFATGDDPVLCHLCGKDTSVAMIARHLIVGHGVDPQGISDAEIVADVPSDDLREEAERLHGALVAAAGLLERLGSWFIETKPPASKEFEVEIVQTVERIIADLQERDSGL